MSEQSPVDAMSYEEAYRELEEIVRLLETDSKSLEESLALYERGQALAARCGALLDGAELRIRSLDAGQSSRSDELFAPEE